MLTCFRELENLFNNKDIHLMNIYMDKVFQKIDFICLTKDNYVKEINQRKKYLNIITVDLFKSISETCNEEYFIFVVDDTILIINISDLSIVNYFFTYYSNYTFYYVSDIAIQFLDERFSNFKINFSKKNQINFIHDEITNFRPYIVSKNAKIDKKLQIVKNCISGYLIQKSYQKSNIFRINHLKKEQYTNFANKPSTYNKYITFNKYFVGSSKVNLAYNIEEGKLFIIKIHHQNREMQKLINRELNNYRNLNHPLLPSFYEYFEEDNINYLVIEYINGVTINKVDLNEFKEIELMNMIFELMISLHYIHSLDYIYRDLKPENIVIDIFKTAILIDFDRIISEKEQFEKVEFTNDFESKFIAPEILNGNNFTNKADIFSFGKLIYGIFLSSSLKNISKSIYSKLNIMYENCIKYEPKERPTISQLIRYFYLNILSKIDEKQGIENELIKIYENNFDIKNLFDPDGLCTLGMIFHQGFYIEKDIREAVKYYSKASNQNDLISLINLYDLEINPLDNILKAVKLYPNEPLTFHLLGSHYFFSKGLINEAINCLKSAYQLGFNVIPYYLGLIYFFTSNEMKDYDYQFANNNQQSETNPLKYFLCASKNKKLNEKNNDFYDIHGQLVLPNLEIALYYKLFTGHLISTVSKYFIGFIYYSGKFKKKNVFMAFKYFSEVAEEENITLQDFLRKNNLEQKYISENDLIIINYVLQSYNNAIIYSNDFLGLIYMEGSYISLDNDKALRYLLKPGNKNETITYIILGYYYSTKNDIIKAIKYYSLAEKNFNNFGMLYGYSYISQNLSQKAIDPIKEIFSHALSNLTVFLGDIYYKGNFVSKDINKAIKFYQIASDCKNSYAQYCLGKIYFDGVYVERKINKALNYLEYSAKLKNKDAQFFLGLLYYEGKSIPQDIDKAIYYFKLADENACKFARLYLGIICCINEDYENAIHYFIKSSNLGYSCAKNNLAIVCKNKENTKNNIYFSIELLNEAIDTTGDILARYNLAHIYFYNHEYRNINESIKLLTHQSLISIDEGFQLLCLAIIDKYELLINDNIDDKKPAIENEIKQYNSQYKKITSKICIEIISNEWLDIDNYTKKYDNIEKNEFIYIDDGKTILSLKNIYYLKNIQNQTITIDKKKDINDQFYEGFGEFI